ncbi:hypothetical protein [Vibrio alginolyticus]|uniref:hypothetical protein n=1 Tax=Vibrio alginolyticus TaxID=663 RepID=UPI0006CA74F7|nr:hypothetical protein [Vibrio alginolyticus]KPM98648.1 hypothetical protein AOG25_09525 [Vibrio alginolyticus]CAH7164882.1 conserved exported hypothetical protein [Vibrio chagasii]CAH7334648.1 conserved exported hypothetical protein [Vibrio chagasii]
MFRPSLIAIVAASVFSTAAFASGGVSKLANKSLDGVFESHQQSNVELISHEESSHHALVGELLQGGKFDSLKQYIDMKSVYSSFLKDTAGVVGQIDALDSLLGGSASSTLDVKYHTGQALVSMLSFQFKAQLELYKEDPENFVRLLSSRVKVYPIAGCTYASVEEVEVSCAGEQFPDVWHTKIINGKPVIYKVDLAAMQDATYLIDGILKKTY